MLRIGLTFLFAMGLAIGGAPAFAESHADAKPAAEKTCTGGGEGCCGGGKSCKGAADGEAAGECPCKRAKRLKEKAAKLAEEG